MLQTKKAHLIRSLICLLFFNRSSRHRAGMPNNWAAVVVFWLTSCLQAIQVLFLLQFVTVNNVKP